MQQINGAILLQLIRDGVRWDYVVVLLTHGDFNKQVMRTNAWNYFAGYLVLVTILF